MSASPGIGVTTIDDPADPRLVHYAAMRERDLVGREGRFIVEGEVTLRVMLSPASRFRTESILLAPGRVATLSDTIAALPAPPPIYVADKAVMSALAGFPIHRGVLAVGMRAGMRDTDSLLAPPPGPATVVALVGLTNHDNVGALFRNAAAFGADAVLLDPATCDPLYRKAIRVSAGTALTVPFQRLESAEAILAYALRHDLTPLALTPGAEDELGRIPLPARAMILLGTEGTGLPPALMAKAKRVRIGMVPGIDSLNVATAGAIALQHLWMTRQCMARDNRRQLQRT